MNAPGVRSVFTTGTDKGDSRFHTACLITPFVPGRYLEICPD